MKFTGNLLMKLGAVVLLLGSCNVKKEFVQKEIEQFEVAKEGAWCWFADPRAIHYQNEDGSINRTFIGYIDIHGNIKASQYDFNSKEKQDVLVRSWFQPDDHDNPTFLVLPDERVMIFYSRHTDEPCFYYRVSDKPGDITNLGPEFKIPTKRNTTYPSPFILSDDPDHFYLCWRGISWHPTIAKLSLPDKEGKVNVEWGPEQIVQSTASRPYAKYTSNGKDRIYLAYTTGHPDPTMPNYLYCNYIDINSMELKDITGKVISKIGEDLHHVAATQEYKENYSYAVVDDTNLRDWLWQVVLDENDYPVIAMVQINEDKTVHDYYYAHWNGKDWKKTFLTHAGGHFHQSPDIELCYSAGMTIDDQNPKDIYCSVPVAGKHGDVYELVKYAMDDNDNVCCTDTLTKNSEFNNARPYIIPNREKSPLKLIWMKGNYYDWIVSKDRPLGFCTSVYSDFEFANQGQIEGEQVINKEVDTEGNSLPRNYTLDSMEEFTITMDVQMDTAHYYGVLLDMGDVKYSLDAESWKPVVEYKGKSFLSTNKYANSDIWTVSPRSTNGVWYAPSKLNKLRLMVSCKNNLLTFSVNGLTDQVISVENLQMKELKIGDVISSMESIIVYKSK